MTDNLEESLLAALRSAAADPMVPGVLGAVLAPGIGIDWRGATPHRRIDGRETESPDTPFRIASATKMVVASAILRLVEQGRLDLDAPIAGLASPEIVAQLRAGGIDPEVVRLIHLLGHTSGLRDHVARPDYPDMVIAGPARRWSRAEQIGLALDAGQPWAAPGKWFRYSDTGYVILGDILERATSQPIGPAVRNAIGFDRFDLRSTWWEEQEPVPAGAPPRAAQFMHAADLSTHDPSFDLYGGGGLVSTVGDLARLTRGLVLGNGFDRPGTLAAAYLISDATRAPEAVFVHSAAFMAFPVAGRFGWGHAGFWGCVGVCLPDLDITIAATINQARPSEPNLLFRLVDALYAGINAAV